MGKVFEAIDDSLASWIQEQRLFFVATAPLAADGLVNCSPKGLDSFAILDPHNVAYLDLTGSGAETIAHVRENGRIVIMFCAFEGPARIVRLYGQGTVIEPHHPQFPALSARFPELPGVRSVIRVVVQRIADSCGYGVPLYEYRRQRESLVKHHAHLGPEGIAAFQAEHNRYSLDGLPALAEE